jgi:hypothetical protein
VKKCFKCGTPKELNDFYEHPQMADGHLNKCKECTKRDTAARVAAMPDGGREYERLRNQEPNRKLARRRYSVEHRQRYPQKRQARLAVGYALKSGKLVKKPCEVCGSLLSEAHHPDYSKPLDVRWLCIKHHREADRLLRESKLQW